MNRSLGNAAVTAHSLSDPSNPPPILFLQRLDSLLLDRQHRIGVCATAYTTSKQPRANLL